MNFETAQTTYGPSDRLSGILLHPTSLPSPYGIGDLGDGAYEFIDFLNKAGQHLWQVLPLNPTGFGDSPYQSFSAFAGQPLLISPDDLQKLDLISAEDLKDLPNTDPKTVDYGAVIPWKNELLRKAYEKFCHTADKMLLEEYDSFCRENSFWLSDYTLYMACKSANDGRSWLEWETPYRNPSPAEKAELILSLKHEINYYKFIQFIFFRQWYALKTYANDKDVKIIGDIPIFVSLDSADVWSHQELFLLDAEGYPTVVAGVPPDYFSETGQLWGNPLYDWKAIRKPGTPGGLRGFVISSILLTICGLIISVDLKLSGQFLPMPNLLLLEHGNAVQRNLFFLQSKKLLETICQSSQKILGSSRRKSKDFGIRLDSQV